MSEHEYNYAVFDMKSEMGKFTDYQNHALHAGGLAPDFPLEDLDSGDAVRMQDLWSGGLAIVEFGSST